MSRYQSGSFGWTVPTSRVRNSGDTHQIRRWRPGILRTDAGGQRWLAFPQLEIPIDGGQCRPDLRRGKAAENDHRVTRIGRLMRATAMDEIPQLWNIFKGDMSFVGPRALRPEEFEIRAGRRVALSDIEGYAERHSIVPGLTGLAQVYAERDIPARSKFRFDRLYLRRRGFWFDLKLIAFSVWITLRGKWEKRGSKL